MNLHVMLNEKFTEPFVEMINAHFPKEEHQFLILGKWMALTVQTDANVRCLERYPRRGVSTFIRDMHRANKIIIHGLFDQALVQLLALQPWLLKKVYWVMWGGDIHYWSQFSKITWAHHYVQWVRKRIIPRFGGLVGHIPAESEYARTLYRTQAKVFDCILYPSNLFKEQPELAQSELSDTRSYVLVGNSADPSNEHLSLFARLEPHVDASTVIVCPLSYGNAAYREQVLASGRELFGERFMPLIDFIPFAEYAAILGKVQVALFAHRRQQAMGNIISLLGYGKKVYVRDDIFTWDYLASHLQLTVFASNGDLSDVLMSLSDKQRESNMQTIRKVYSLEKLLQQWQAIFAAR